MALPATSGDSVFTYTRDQLCRAALRKIGAISFGEIPDEDIMEGAVEALNLMVKEWEADGIHLWTESEAILFLQPNQQSYVLGPGSADITGASWNLTGLVTTNPGGSVFLQVASSAGFTVGDMIGIALDGGPIFFTELVGIGVAPPAWDAAGATWDQGANWDQGIQVKTVLPGQASAGAVVTDSSNPIAKPLQVPSGRTLLYNGGNEIPMERLSRKSYMELPNKNATGTPTQFFYSPQRATGLLYVWPVPVLPSWALRLTWYRPIQTFDTAANIPDLPEEWGSTLVYNLAAELIPEYGTPLARAAGVIAKAQDKLDRLRGWDREPESVFFGVDFDREQS